MTFFISVTLIVFKFLNFSIVSSELVSIDELSKVNKRRFFSSSVNPILFKYIFISSLIVVFLGALINTFNPELALKFIFINSLFLEIIFLSPMLLFPLGKISFDI